MFGKSFCFFLFFKRLLNTPQRYNTNATINYKYVTVHYTMNFNGKVTVQKKKKIRSKYRQHYGTKSKGRAHFLLNLPMLLVLTHMYFSVSYLILTLDEKAVMTGRV